MVPVNPQCDAMPQRPSELAGELGKPCATRHPFVADTPAHRCHPAGMPRQHAAPANVVAGAAGCRVLLLLTVNWKSCLNRLHVATPRNQDREFPIALVWRRVGLVDSDGRQAG